MTFVRTRSSRKVEGCSLFCDVHGGGTQRGGSIELASRLVATTELGQDVRASKRALRRSGSRCEKSVVSGKRRAVVLFDERDGRETEQALVSLRVEAQREAVGCCGIVEAVRVNPSKPESV